MDTLFMNSENSKNLIPIDYHSILQITLAFTVHGKI